MSRFGDALRRVPAPITYGVVCVVLTGAVVAIVMQLRPEKLVAREDPGRMVYCGCAQCGHVIEASAAELVDKGILDPIERTMVTDQGKRCPKCGRNGLDVAFKCPKDDTVFLFGRRAGRVQGCPKCGWDPYSR